MKTKINDGGAAFPFEPRIDENTGRPTNDGISKRDYFAAKAMPTMIDRLACVGKTKPSDVAAACYQLADAMLAERGKGLE